VNHFSFGGWNESKIRSMRHHRKSSLVLDEAEEDNREMESGGEDKLDELTHQRIN